MGLTRSGFARVQGLKFSHDLRSYTDRRPRSAGGSRCEHPNYYDERIHHEMPFIRERIAEFVNPWLRGGLFPPLRLALANCLALSVSGIRGRGDPRTRHDPVVVGLKRYAKLAVENSQIAVTAARNRPRRNRLDFLRHHADIGLVTAVVAEAIET